MGRISRQAFHRAESLTQREGALRKTAAAANPAPGLFAALRNPGSVAVIAEIKRRSPSKGVLDGSIDAPARAQEFERGGASAISVLTEPDHFGGSNDDLPSVRSAVSIPLIRKDFHVEPVQLFEARALGASAALLIVRALGPDQTRRMADAAAEAGLEAFFEVRSEEELNWSLEANATIVGVNRRNLESLEMESEVLERVLPLIPRGCIAIAESGISTRADVEAVASLGADAVLVGSSLSVAADATRSVAALCDVAKQGRHA